MKLSTYLPILSWLPTYKKSYLKGDLSAGLTVGVMLIPQGMAYATLAGLPPVYGLYASMLPQIIYAFTGTSRQLAVGPVAMDSLLVAAGVSLLAELGTEEYILLAILTAFLVGTFQLLLGVFRLGFLVNFLSRPVLSGFTSAAAILIGLSQVKHLTATDIPRSTQIQALLISAVEQLPHTHFLTLVMGIIGIALIRVVKKVNKTYRKSIPAALIVVVLGIGVVFSLNLEAEGVLIVKEIPDGLPAFKIPSITWARVSSLLPISATIAFIAFIQSIAVAKTLQNKHKDYEVDANQELIALGLSNVIGSFFQSYNTAGGLSRSAVNDQAGAKSGVAALIAAVLVGLTLLFLTPIFYYLPKVVLAAIIITASIGLVELEYPKKLWKNQREEFWMLFVTFSITLTVGIREGILVGIIFSLAVVIYKSTRPHVAELGLLKGTNEYRNLTRFEELEERKEVLILRYDAQLYFANTAHFKDTILKAVERKGEHLKLFVLNAEGIHTLDSTGAEVLHEVIEELKQKNIITYLTGVIGPVRDTLFRTGLMQEIGEEHFFLDIPYAVACFDSQTSSKPKHATQSNFR